MRNKETRCARCRKVVKRWGERGLYWVQKCIQIINGKGRIFTTRRRAQEGKQFLLSAGTHQMRKRKEDVVEV